MEADIEKLKQIIKKYSAGVDKDVFDKSLGEARELLKSKCTTIKNESSENIKSYRDYFEAIKDELDANDDVINDNLRDFLMATFWMGDKLSINPSVDAVAKKFKDDDIVDKNLKYNDVPLSYKVGLTLKQELELSNEKIKLLDKLLSEEECCWDDETKRAKLYKEHRAILEKNMELKKVLQKFNKKVKERNTLVNKEKVQYLSDDLLYNGKLYFTHGCNPSYMVHHNKLNHYQDVSVKPKHFITENGKLYPLVHNSDPKDFFTSTTSFEAIPSDGGYLEDLITGDLLDSDGLGSVTNILTKLSEAFNIEISKDKGDPAFSICNDFDCEAESLISELERIDEFLINCQYESINIIGVQIIDKVKAYKNRLKKLSNCQKIIKCYEKLDAKLMQIEHELKLVESKMNYLLQLKRTLEKIKQFPVKSISKIFKTPSIKPNDEVKRDIEANYVTKDVIDKTLPEKDTAPTFATYSIKESKKDSVLIMARYRINKLYRFRYKIGMHYSFYQHKNYEITNQTEVSLTTRTEGLGFSFGLQTFLGKKVDIRQPGFRGSQNRWFMYTGFLINKNPVKNFILGGGWEPINGLSIMSGVHVSPTEELIFTSNGFTTTDKWRAYPFVSIGFDLNVFNRIFNISWINF